jgi:hypothetical protein
MPPHTTDPINSAGAEVGVMGGGDQKLEVIRKLLAKAEKAATAEEASAYNAKAAQMMARHGVDDAMLAATGVKQDALGERRIALADPTPTRRRKRIWRA